MICYRLVRKKFISLDSDFFNSEHSKRNLSRWHTNGMPALYFADSKFGAIMECGKYWVCDVAKELNQIVELSKGKPPLEWNLKYQALSKIEGYIATVEVDDALPILDLTMHPPAHDLFQKAGFPDLRIPDTRKNVITSIDKHATRHIGKHYAGVRAPILKAVSARYEGNCLILFPGNFEPKQVRLAEKIEVTLYALDSNSKRISGNKIAKLNESMLGYDLDGSTGTLAPLKL